MNTARTRVVADHQVWRGDTCTTTEVMVEVTDVDEDGMVELRFRDSQYLKVPLADLVEAALAIALRKTL